jgi:hypothetical protein
VILTIIWRPVGGGEITAVIILISLLTYSMEQSPS